MKKETEMNTQFREWLETNGCLNFSVSAEKARGLIDDLTKRLPGLVRGSSGLVFEGKRLREKSFRLGPAIRGTTAPTHREAKAERAIINFYKARNLSGSEDSAFLERVHSYQVPLRARGREERRTIDLLGSTGECLPAVIELKRSSKGRSAGKLFGQILQGLAYTVTVRYFYNCSNQFRNEWSGLHPGAKIASSIEGRRTPIIFAANSDWWECSSTWSKCPWSLFLKLAEALEKENLPLFAARFESAEKPELTFARFTALQGHETGTAPIIWP